MDPQANSHKAIEAQAKDKVEKVVQGEVITKKKSLGRKFKDLFIGADARSVVYGVFTDVLLPAARNVIVDATTKGVERLIYGDSNAPNRRIYGSGVPRVTYNTPVDRGYRHPLTRPPSSRPSTRNVRSRDSEEIILESREEAETVLERMSDIINAYGIVSVADLYDLVGIPSRHTDNKWGWERLSGASVRPVREGFLLDLEPAEPIG
jgi:hypothetical protein